MPGFAVDSLPNFWYCLASSKAFSKVGGSLFLTHIAMSWGIPIKKKSLIISFSQRCLAIASLIRSPNCSTFSSGCILALVIVSRSSVLDGSLLYFAMKAVFISFMVTGSTIPSIHFRAFPDRVFLNFLTCTAPLCINASPAASSKRSAIWS